MLKVRTSSAPIECTCVGSKRAVPTSSAVQSWSWKRWSEPTLICTSAGLSGSRVVCVMRSIAVHGTAPRPSWSSRNAAHSRAAPPPTVTPAFIPDSTSIMPVKPLGLDGAYGSSSVGLKTADWVPLELRIM